MNVLLFSPQYDLAGGAVIAANRLYKTLISMGINTKMLVGNSPFENDQVNIIKHNTLGEKLLSRITLPLGLHYIQYYGSFKIANHKFFQEAEVLNFHTIHSGYFNYLALSKLTQLKPSVYTLHDTWSFTGHCGNSYNCNKWKTGCGNCPALSSFPAIKRDNTALEWKLKRWTYNHSNLTIVTPSKWLSNLAHESILSKFKILNIPNGIDINTLTPRNKDYCKAILGIPKGKKVLLFGAMGVEDKRKGADLLFKALQLIPQTIKQDIVLLTLGSGSEQLKNYTDIPMINLGYVSDDLIKSVAFSAADIFLFPTRFDNFPCVLQENMACGTPMVSFNVGGVPEIVRPGITGILAEPENIEEFKNGVLELLEDNKLREVMSKNCRDIAVAEYSLELQSQNYIKLYKSLL